jgi:hypothetical protein
MMRYAKSCAYDPALNAAIRMMHQVGEVVFFARVDRHLERVDGEVTAQ